MNETITLTGNYLGWASFFGLLVFHIFAWALAFRQKKQHIAIQEKRIILREIQLERDKVCSEMISYKKDTGYNFKPEQVKHFTELSIREEKLLAEIEEAT